MSYAFSHEYRFFQRSVNLHSRIQQAFYTLIPTSELEAVHLRLTRVLKRLYLGRSEDSVQLPQNDVNIFVFSVSLSSY